MESIQVFTVHLFQLCCIFETFHNEITENSTYNIRLLYHLLPSFLSPLTWSPTPATFTSLTFLPLLALLQSPARSKPWTHTWIADLLSSLLLVFPHSNPSWMSIFSLTALIMWTLLLSNFWWLSINNLKTLILQQGPCIPASSYQYDCPMEIQKFLATVKRDNYLSPNTTHTSYPNTLASSTGIYSWVSRDPATGLSSSAYEQKLVRKLWPWQVWVSRPPIETQQCYASTESTYSLCSLVHSFIYSLTHLLSTYYMPDNLLEAAKEVKWQDPSLKKPN